MYHPSTELLEKLEILPYLTYLNLLILKDIQRLRETLMSNEFASPLGASTAPALQH